MKPEDFYIAAKVEDVYYGELHALLLDTFKPKRVEILEHLVSFYEIFPSCRTKQ